MAQKPMVGKGEHGARGWVVPTLLPVHRTSALRGVKAPAWWLEGAARLPPELRRTYDFSNESFHFSCGRCDRGMGPNGISASGSDAVAGFEHMKCLGLA